MTRFVGIYIHVPFCRRKCPYCNFYSVQNPTTPLAARALQERYFAAVTACLLDYADQGLVADTLYFGGGTPSLVETDLILGVVQSVKRWFALSGEVTLEANPSDLKLQALQRLRAGGVNRISMGMQSAVSVECRELGRTHTPSQVELAVQRLKQAGFSNFSLDLMLGIPHQTAESLAQTLNVIEALSPPHLSAYLLKVEPETPFFRYRNERGELFPDEDTQCDWYLWAVERLSQMGLMQYEISNFARPGFESLHNLKYWKRQEYLGVGASAHSFFSEKRFSYPNDIERFITVENHGYQLEEASPSPREEALLLGLRLREGIDLKWYSETFARDLELVRQQLLRYQQAGLITLQGDRLALTPKGFLVSNRLIATFLDW